MATSQAFWIDRITLAAGVKTPVYAPRISQACNVGNATADDVKVYSHHGETDDSSHYLVIATTFERQLSAGKNVYRRDEPAFWLESTPGGLVILIWL